MLIGTKNRLLGGRGAAEFPVVEDAATGTDPSGTTKTCNMPTGITAGEYLLFLIAIDSTFTIDSLVTDWNTTIDWSEFMLVNFNEEIVFQGAWRIADGTEPSTVDVTANSVRQSCSIIYRISGAAVQAPAFAGSSLTVLDFDPPNLVAPWGSTKNLWFAAKGSKNEPAISGGAPTGYSDPDVAEASTTWATAAWRQFEAGSEDPDVFSALGGEDPDAHAGATICIRPA